MPHPVRTFRLVFVALLAASALFAASPAVASGSTARDASARTAVRPTVIGNQLVDGRTGAQFIPRGVNWPSFEYACKQGWGYADRGGAPDEAAATAAAMTAWGINAVRVPLNQECWLGENGLPDTTNGHPELTAEGYRDAVAAFTAAMNRAGIVVILDLHWTDPAGIDPPGIPGGDVGDGGLRPVPDGRSVAFWSSVASRFKDDLSVMFDAFNEPHSRWNPTSGSWAFELSWSCWAKGGCSAPVENDLARSHSGATYVAAGMGSLVAAIRAEGANQPVILSGLDYGNDLRGWQEARPSDSQLVAGFHNYPDQRCNGQKDRECWINEVATLRWQVPVITTEFGQNDCDAKSGGDASHMKTFMKWADRYSIGYLAWAWWVLPEQGCSNFALVSDHEGTPEPPFGTALHEHLASLGGPTPDVGPTGATGPTGPTGPAGPVALRPAAGGPRSGKTKRARTRLKIRRVTWRRSTLTSRMTINPLAGLAVRVRVRVRLASGRRQVIPVRVNVGTAPVLKVKIALPARARPLRIVARYPGDQRVRPQKVAASIRPAARPD